MESSTKLWSLRDSPKLLTLALTMLESAYISGDKSPIYSNS